MGRRRSRKVAAPKKKPKLEKVHTFQLVVFRFNPTICNSIVQFQSKNNIFAVGFSFSSRHCLIRIEKIQVFDCPFCGHNNTVEVKMNRQGKIGKLAYAFSECIFKFQTRFYQNNVCFSTVVRKRILKFKCNIIFSLSKQVPYVRCVVRNEDTLLARAGRRVRF